MVANETTACETTLLLFSLTRSTINPTKFKNEEYEYHYYNVLQATAYHKHKAKTQKK